MRYAVLMKLLPDCRGLPSTGDRGHAEAGKRACHIPVGLVPVFLLLFTTLTIPVDAAAPVCGVTIVAQYPHDENSFTQGLAFSDYSLEFYEGSGLYGESTLRLVELTSGSILQSVDLDASLFGEGITVIGDEIFQLSWQEHTALLWDRPSMTQTGNFSYSTEGWGLCDNGTHLVMSDGSESLFFRNPADFQLFGEVIVHDGQDAVTHLNELEWLNGEVLANVWLTDEILRIDPETGEVIARIDCSTLPRPQSADVLNGIAWDGAGEHLYVTGKFWPTLYEIELSLCPELPLFRDGFGFGDASSWSWSTIGR